MMSIHGAADFLLKYMRQQRCGYNPFLKDSCHTHDGFIVGHPTLDSQLISMSSGGWHDASDYLQYVTTSANATYPDAVCVSAKPTIIFRSIHDANGTEGSNGIPDILDEAEMGP
jgi:endoglucanase